MVDEVVGSRGPIDPGKQKDTNALRKTSYEFSTSKVDMQLANLLSGGGSPTELDTHNEWVKVNDYLEENKQNLTLNDRSIIQEMLDKFKKAEEEFEVSQKTSDEIPVDKPVPQSLNEEQKDVKYSEKVLAQFEHYGRDVGEKLASWTSVGDQKDIAALLKDIDSANVTAFLKGAYNGLGYNGGEGLIEALDDDASDYVTRDMKRNLIDAVLVRAEALGLRDNPNYKLLKTHYNDYIKQHPNAPGFNAGSFSFGENYNEKFDDLLRPLAKAMIDREFPKNILATQKQPPTI